MIMNKNVSNNLEAIYLTKEVNMENPTIFEIIQDPYHYEKFSNNALRYLIVMEVLTKNNLTFGYALTERDEFVELLKRELKIFDYSRFRNNNTMQISFDEDQVNVAIKQLLKELGALGSSYIKRAINV